jgi:hypothetical protein
MAHWTWKHPRTTNHPSVEDYRFMLKVKDRLADNDQTQLISRPIRAGRTLKNNKKQRELDAVANLQATETVHNSTGRWPDPGKFKIGCKIRRLDRRRDGAVTCDSDQRVRTTDWGGGMESVQACEGTPVDRIIFVTIIIIMFFFRYY